MPSVRLGHPHGELPFPDPLPGASGATSIRIVFVDQLLFLPFLVRRLLFAPLAPFLELDFALHEFAVLAAPVVDTLALGAGKLDELFLWHICVVE